MHRFLVGGPKECTNLRLRSWSDVLGELKASAKAIFFLRGMKQYSKIALVVFLVGAESVYKIVWSVKRGCTHRLGRAQEKNAAWVVGGDESGIQNGVGRIW